MLLERCGQLGFAVVDAGLEPEVSAPPAMPMTRAPAILAIWPATEPVAPAAAETTTVSPGWGRPMSFIPK
jgi:hypothetical protein